MDLKVKDCCPYLKMQFMIHPQNWKEEFKFIILSKCKNILWKIK
jgi:hypothetical protein